MKLSAFFAGTGLIAACSVFTAAVSTNINGTVEYSGGENVRFIRTEKFLYEIDPRAVSPADQKKLEQIGATVSFNPPPGSVTRAWPISADGKEAANTKIPVDSIKGGRSKITLTGTVLPTSSEKDRYIDIAGTVFRLDAAVLSKSALRQLNSTSGKISLQVPPDAIRFAWKFIPAKPTSSFQRFFVKDHIETRGEWTKIRGTVAPSPEENSVVVQAKNTFFLIHKSLLGKIAVKRPGSRIALAVPTDQISLTWSLDAHSDSVVRRMSAPVR